MARILRRIFLVIKAAEFCIFTTYKNIFFVFQSFLRCLAVQMTLCVQSLCLTSMQVNLLQPQDLTGYSARRMTIGPSSKALIIILGVLRWDRDIFQTDIFQTGHFLDGQISDGHFSDGAYFRLIIKVDTFQTVVMAISRN